MSVLLLIIVAVFAWVQARYSEEQCKEFSKQRGYDGYYNRNGDYIKF